MRDWLSNSGKGLLSAVSHEDHYPCWDQQRFHQDFLANQIAGQLLQWVHFAWPKQNPKVKACTAKNGIQGYTVPVSEVGLCVTHWASGSSFAENDIRLTFSREGVGGLLMRPSLGVDLRIALLSGSSKARPDARGNATFGYLWLCWSCQIAAAGAI